MTPAATVMAAKPCALCLIEKPLDDFHIATRSKDGRQGRCKECAKAVARDWYRANTKRAEGKVIAWRENNRDKVRHAQRKHKVKKVYGLEWQDYLDLIAVRGDVCWICGTTEPGRKGSLAMCVDHDHATGRVRGLLCQSCNVGIARFRDDPDLLARAIRYLGGDL